jgi:hypothetical protein
LNDPEAGFQKDTNKISIIDTFGKTDFPAKPKIKVADDIIDFLISHTKE